MKILFFITLVAFLQSATSVHRSSSGSSDSSSDDSSSDDSSSASDSKPCKIKYGYTLWIGDDVHDAYTIKLKSDCDIMFIDAMDQAAAKKTKFNYTKKDHSQYGAFITSIAGVQNDLNRYWTIYELDSKPNVHNKPPDSLQSDFGVSSLEVVDGRHYLFWFKTVDWH